MVDGDPAGSRCAHGHEEDAVLPTPRRVVVEVDLAWAEPDDIVRFDAPVLRVRALVGVESDPVGPRQGLGDQVLEDRRIFELLDPSPNGG